MGINSGLRVQDLLALKIGDVRSFPVGERISLREKKTGKENVFILNKEISLATTREATSLYRDEYPGKFQPWPESIHGGISPLPSLHS